jgi:hypothetical protein
MSDPSQNLSFRAEFRHPYRGWRNAVEEPAVGRAEELVSRLRKVCPLADKPCCARNDIGVRFHNIVQSLIIHGAVPRAKV